jgi:hypothetical protein
LIVSVVVARKFLPAGATKPKLTPIAYTMKQPIGTAQTVLHEDSLTKENYSPQQTLIANL